jgi:hypothetical protein
MTKLIDLTGQRFGRLTVVCRVKNHRNGRARWLCRCDCGGERSPQGNHLKHGKISSCGCYRAELSFVHGMTNTPTYQTWGNMIARCTNPKNTGYYLYGGRGISICERWFDFNNFFADMGKRPPRKSLDRIDNDGNYEPSNCRWATRKEQRRNQRTVSKLATEVERLRRLVTQLGGVP